MIINIIVSFVYYGNMKMKEDIAYVTNILNKTGRKEKYIMLDESPLKNREIKILSMRYIEGRSIIEISDELHLSYEGVVKAQHKALVKLYEYLQNK